MPQLNPKSLGRLLLLVALAILLFHAPFWLVAPFKWFEVYFHEISHGLVALLTGGSIERIHIQYGGSGSCHYRGGHEPLIAFSGYAGAALWGWAIYEIGHASRRQTVALLISLALVLLLVSGLLWVRDIQTSIILLLMGTLLALMLRLGDLDMMKLFVEFIGIFVLLAAIQSPLFLLDGRSLGDGAALQRLTLIPESVWVVLWMLIGLAILLLLVRDALRGR